MMMLKTKMTPAQELAAMWAVYLGSILGATVLALISIAFFGG